MRSNITAVGALALAMTAMAGEASAAEASIRYSAFVVPTESYVVHGWQASAATDTGRTLQWVLEGGGGYAGGGSLHTLMAGPRWGTRPSRNGTRLFVQLLAGPGLVSADESGLLLVAVPGAGVDFGVGPRAGFRVQLDGPLVTNYGVLPLPRVSAGIVLRPGRR